MTDKIAPGELMNEVNALTRERNMLRAEINEVWANIAQERNDLRAENEQWRTDWLSMQAENERLRAALSEVLTIDHSKRGCCEWHILNGKPWIPMPSSVLHVSDR